MDQCGCWLQTRCCSFVGSSPIPEAFPGRVRHWMHVEVTGCHESLEDGLAAVSSGDQADPTPAGQPLLLCVSLTNSCRSCRHSSSETVQQLLRQPTPIRTNQSGLMQTTLVSTLEHCQRRRGPPTALHLTSQHHRQIHSHLEPVHWFCSCKHSTTSQSCNKAHFRFSSLPQQGAEAVVALWRQETTKSLVTRDSGHNLWESCGELVQRNLLEQKQHCTDQFK
jgi:hypothetical protein